MVSAIRCKVSDLSEKLCGRSPWKSLFMCVLLLYAFVFAIRLIQLNYSLLPFQLLWNHHQDYMPTDCDNKSSHTSNTSSLATNVDHIFFAIAGSTNTWDARQFYVKQWWKPQVTKGFVWLDKAPKFSTYIWTSTPPYKIYGDTSKLKDYANFGHAFTIRIMRVMLEAHNAMKTMHGSEDFRWFVMVDDDTVLFIDNLVDVLGQYDHNGYHYIGGTSECVWQNGMHSFSMAYGGAGYAVSYPLVKAMARILEGCIKRYQNVYGSNQVTEACMKDLGVSLTKIQGFHQFDLLGDISGLLSAHPHSPLISFHHLDNIEPIFPHLGRHNSLRQLSKAAAVDSSRLLQQSLCYHSNKNWSISVSWGYTVHIYEKIHTPSMLQTPAQTFRPWNDKWNEPNTFMFNVRPYIADDPCLVPHVFYFESIEVMRDGNGLVTNYSRKKPRNLAACDGGDNSADFINRVQVMSPTTRFNWGNGRKECCEFVSVNGDMAKVLLKTCSEIETLNEAILFRDDI